MKKILIISNLHHCSPRIPNIVTHLPDFGWYPTIITPPLVKDAANKLGFPRNFLDKVKIIEVPFVGDIFWFWRKMFNLFGFKADESITEQIKGKIGINSTKNYINFLVNLYHTFFAYPDTEINWKTPAIEAASLLLEHENFDAVLSSSPFPTYHIIASELKKKFQIKWLADFRDPWTQNHNYPYGSIRKYFEQKLEKNVIKNADIMIAAAPSYAQKQEKLHGKKAFVITNGFNAENLKISVPSLTKKFTITYTGSIYEGKQDPEKLLIVLKEMIFKKTLVAEDIEVRFYGAKQNWLKNLIFKHNVMNVVKCYGLITQSEAIEKQKESQLLLLFNWEDTQEKGVYPSKLFEYLSAQRPILATGGFRGDEIENILLDLNAGFYAPALEDIDKSISDLYAEYKRKGRVPFDGNIDKIYKYSFYEKAKELSEILKKDEKDE